MLASLLLWSMALHGQAAFPFMVALLLACRALASAQPAPLARRRLAAVGRRPARAAAPAGRLEIQRRAEDVLLGGRSLGLALTVTGLAMAYPDTVPLGKMLAPFRSRVD